MHRRSLLTLASTLLFALAPAYGAFLNNDIGSTNVLVNFDQLNVPTQLTGTPVLTHNLNGYTVNMNVPSFGTGDGEVYVIDLLPANIDTDPFLVNTNPSTNIGANRRAIEFTLAGNAVSAIGIRISAWGDGNYTDVTLEIFGNSGLIESHTIEGPGALAGRTLDAPNSEPSLGGFYGFEIATPTITRFRISGGPIALDDLRFTSATGDPDPDPDPSAVPEASTFLLCASALGLLSLAGRFRRKTGAPGR